MGLWDQHGLSRLPWTGARHLGSVADNVIPHEYVFPKWLLDEVGVSPRQGSNLCHHQTGGRGSVHVDTGTILGPHQILGVFEN